MDIRRAVHMAAEDLRRRGCGTPRLDAEVILAQCLGVERTFLYIHPERMLDDRERERFAACLARRQAMEPVAYITGSREFWSLPLAVDRRVLIPRAETEILVEEALCMARRRPAERLRILDVGTGSGAVAVALATELPAASIVATDLSDEILSLAAGNARRHGVGRRIAFIRADLFPPPGDPFDVIVSNPPYVPDGDFPRLPAGVREYEPRIALLAGEDGTDLHCRIAAECLVHLRGGGGLAMEFGAGQADRVRGILRETGGFEDIAVRADYGGIDRVVVAKKKA